MHPFLAYYLWFSAMTRIMRGETADAAPSPLPSPAPSLPLAPCARSDAAFAAVPALGQYLVTDVTRARLPDRFLDLLGELHWPDADARAA